MYQADNELEDVLIKHGFIETTSEEDKLKGKKSFKLSKNSRKEIYFDYINIKVENSAKGMDSTTRMNEKELKFLLLYFKLKTNDFKEFSTNGTFNFAKVEERLVRLYQELEDLKRFNVQKLRQNKISRILHIYESIII